MADEDNKNTPDQKSGDDIATLRSEVDNKLAQLNRQLELVNNQFAQGFKNLSEQLTPKEQEIDETDVFDPRKLRDKILGEATKATNEIIAEERRKNAVLVGLSKEYPEIQTDSKFQDAVLEAQRGLPKMLQDTAEGYELAVMKAVAKQGILPKSRRKDDAEPEFTGSGSSGSGARERGSPKKQKLDDRTLIMAQLLGRDINDPKVIKSLEEAAGREFSKYR